MDKAQPKIKQEQKQKESKQDQNKSTWPPSHLLAETPTPIPRGHEEQGRTTQSHKVPIQTTHRSLAVPTQNRFYFPLIVGAGINRMST